MHPSLKASWNSLDSKPEFIDPLKKKKKGVFDGETEIDFLDKLCSKGVLILLVTVMKI